jgi:hypothetical protein
MRASRKERSGGSALQVYLELQTICYGWAQIKFPSIPHPSLEKRAGEISGGEADAANAGFEENARCA